MNCNYCDKEFESDGTAIFCSEVCFDKGGQDEADNPIMKELSRAKDQLKFEHCKKSIQVILDAIKVESFTNPQNATNEEAMGLLVSKFFEWDGVSILEASKEALEDANYHTESGLVSDMLEKYGDDDGEGCEEHGTSHLHTEWVDGVSQGMVCKACEEFGPPQ